MPNTKFPKFKRNRHFFIYFDKKTTKSAFAVFNALGEPRILHPVVKCLSTINTLFLVLIKRHTIYYYEYNGSTYFCESKVMILLTSTNKIKVFFVQSTE